MFELQPHKGDAQPLLQLRFELVGVGFHTIVTISWLPIVWKEEFPATEIDYNTF